MTSRAVHRPVRPTLMLMRWAMKRWERTKWLNRLGGALGAALQVDYLPGFRSGVYLLIRRAPENAGQPAEAEELTVMGRSIQRFWLNSKATWPDNAARPGDARVRPLRRTPDTILERTGADLTGRKPG